MLREEKSRPMDELDGRAYFTLVQNEPWVVGALVLGYSLRKSETTAKLVCQVGRQISDESLLRLEAIYDIVEDARVYRFPESKFNSMTEVPEKLMFSFRRLNAWLRTEYDRITYLDSDLFVMKNIDTLFEIPGVAAPREFEFRVWQAGRTYTDFFNGGMVSFSPSKDTYGRFAEILEKRWVYLGAAEQHLINVVCRDDWYRVPDFYHVQAGAWQHAHFVGKSENIGAVHFSKISKPWGSKYTGRKSLWRAWRAYAVMWAKMLRDYEAEYSESIGPAKFWWEDGRRNISDREGARHRTKVNSVAKNARQKDIASQSPQKLAEIAVFKGAFQKISELGKLISLLRRRKLQRIVEIGTYRGGTLWAWCQLATDNGQVVSIDLQGGGEGSGGDQGRLAKYAKEGQRLDFIRGDSKREKTRDTLARLLDGECVDFLFIDGDHSYEAVRRDFELYGPLVRRGGIVSFHDIIRPPAFPENQVYRYWKELKENYVVKEYLDQTDERGWGQWGGIGVVYMP